MKPKFIIGPATKTDSDFEKLVQTAGAVLATPKTLADIVRISDKDEYTFLSLTEDLTDLLSRYYDQIIDSGQVYSRIIDVPDFIPSAYSVSVLSDQFPSRSYAEVEKELKKSGLLAHDADAISANSNANRTGASANPGDAARELANEPEADVEAMFVERDLNAPGVYEHD